jgi:TRAP-type mannitol/chloroaromatic compound transport system substrate-binding protein
MDRREFLKTTGAAAALAGTAVAAAEAATPAPVAAPAVMRGTRELRLAVAWQDGVAGLADQAWRLAQRIATMSDGRYRMVFTPNVRDALAAVRAGDADLYHATESDHLDAHRGLAYFAGLPGDCGVAPHQLQAWLQVGGGQELWDALAGEFGVKAMLAGHTGAPCYFVATRVVDSMSALAGEKVAVRGLARDVARGLGLEPVSLAASELTAAVARGDVLAAEWGGAIASHALGLAKVAPVSTGASISRSGTALSLGIRHQLWDAMPASDRAMLEAAATAELQTALAEEDAHRPILWPQPAPDQTWPIAPELTHAVRRIAEAVVAHTAGSDAAARRINTSYEAFRRAIGTASAATA